MFRPRPVIPENQVSCFLRRIFLSSLPWLLSDFAISPQASVFLLTDISLDFSLADLRPPTITGPRILTPDILNLKQ